MTAMERQRDQIWEELKKVEAQLVPKQIWVLIAILLVNLILNGLLEIAYSIRDLREKPDA